MEERFSAGNCEVPHTRWQELLIEALMAIEAADERVRRLAGELGRPELEEAVVFFDRALLPLQKLSDSMLADRLVEAGHWIQRNVDTTKTWSEQLAEVHDRARLRIADTL